MIQRLINVEELQTLLAENNLPVPALGTGQAYGEEGLSFTNPDPDIRQRAIERIKSQVVLAKQLQAKVIIGLVRGKTEKNIDPMQVESWLVDGLRESASVDETVKLAIEPINRYETDLVNTVSEGLLLLEKVNKNNVGLLLDTFHMNIEEPSILESIILSKNHLFHFHVADSNRWYPGAGHINFKEIIEVLLNIGYEGFVSAEILPNPDSDTAALKAIEHLNKICS